MKLLWLDLKKLRDRSQKSNVKCLVVDLTLFDGG